MARPTRKIYIETVPSDCAETEMVDAVAKIAALLLRVEARRQARLEERHLNEPQKPPSG